MEAQAHDEHIPPSIPASELHVPLVKGMRSYPTPIQRLPLPLISVGRPSPPVISAERQPSPLPGPSGLICSIIPGRTDIVATTEVQSATELDDLALENLGEDPLSKKSVGKNIQKDLAVRFEHLVTTGMTKELRKEILGKYLPPGNCSLVDAPTLNPEVKATVSEIVIKRG